LRRIRTPLRRVATSLRSLPPLNTLLLIWGRSEALGPSHVPLMTRVRLWARA
jgi:hypothetical protein